MDTELDKKKIESKYVDSIFQSGRVAMQARRDSLNARRGSANYLTPNQHHNQEHGLLKDCILQPQSQGR